MRQELFRAIPSVDKLLRQLEEEPRLIGMPRSFLRELVNGYQDLLRSRIRQSEVTSPEELQMHDLLPDLVRYIEKRARPKFRRVINATGVVVHTNLGRSLLPGEAVSAVETACTAYSNLEFDLETGKRGSRYDLVQELLCELTGAEAAVVVNNNAAAVLLTLDTLAQGREVVVSRGELIEIGGSFRIPEVMEKSGAKLREVGATNRTHLYDYQRAIGPETGALLKAHTSNYRIVGFHKEVDSADLVRLGDEHNVPVLEDLGSGNLFPFPDWTGIDEPTVQDTVAKGLSAICFSGDKLLGGPQAGIILGRKETLGRIQKNPLNRALRIDKMTLAALEATLRLYRDPDTARKRVPTLDMICLDRESLRNRAVRLARRIQSRLGDRFLVGTARSTSRVGGGASPEIGLPTQLVRLVPRQPGMDLEGLRSRLLDTDPPLVGRMEDEAFCLDPRTLLRGDGKGVVQALEQATQQGGSEDE